MFRKLFVRLNVKCITPTYHRASLVPQLVENLPAMWETWVQSLGCKDTLEEGMATHSSILAGESHGQRYLAVYGPWGCKELDTTEAT